MKCPQCNKDIVDDSKFCKECGTKLTSAEEAQPAITKTIETRREELTTGSTFAGRYQVIEELGKGGLQWGDIYAKSFNMLGKIYEQQGDTAKAKENYEKFLVLWKDADPGFPEVADAKERVAALEAGDRSSEIIIQELRENKDILNFDMV